MSDWIRTKIGMQAMENIIRFLPRIAVALEELQIELTSHKYRDDLLKLINEMDIRKQENINLNFKLNELKHKVEKGG